mmetsp:Transcript_60735/g.166407  ORF Transcript_60735/g.166407 Transcript_60735/m.166407 type:complete len:177 (-) Transcript_60735:871-1401(-)
MACDSTIELRSVTDARTLPFRNIAPPSNAVEFMIELPLWKETSMSNPSAKIAPPNEPAIEFTIELWCATVMLCLLPCRTAIAPPRLVALEFTIKLPSVIVIWHGSGMVIMIMMAPPSAPSAKVRELMIELFVKVRLLPYVRAIAPPPTELMPFGARRTVEFLIELPPVSVTLLATA